MLTNEEIETILSNDYKTTIYLLKKRILEAGYIYLTQCNERYEPKHVKGLIDFHQWMCRGIDDIVKAMFEDMERGELKIEDAKVYLHRIEINCFSLFLPVIQILQGQFQETEMKEISKIVKWTERWGLGERYLQEKPKHRIYQLKFYELLRSKKVNDLLIKDYEQTMKEAI